MSILLDAVAKQKRQEQQASGDLHQAMLSPTRYQEEKSSLPWGKISGLVLALGGAVFCAWALQYGLKQDSEQLDLGMDASSSQATDQVSNQATSINTTSNELPTPSSAKPQVADGEFALAGKVALPVARQFVAKPQLSQTEGQVSYGVQQSASVNDTNPYVISGNPLSSSNNAKANDVTLARLKQLSEQYDSDLQQAYVDSTRENSAAIQDYEQEVYSQVDDEPIILGANANAKGLRELEALKLQVEMAANEVDFNSVRQTQSVSNSNENNLVAAFEQALKDVEFEQSANNDVTQEALDPIPKVSNQQIPNYGELPASVQLSVPEFSIQAHVYSTDPTERWLNVDGIEMQQGDKIKGKLTIIEIRPRDVILDVDGNQFRVPAI